MTTAIIKYALLFCMAVIIPTSCIRQYPESPESELEIILEADIAQPLGYKRVILNKTGDPTELSIDGQPTDPHIQSPGSILRFVAEVYDRNGKCVDRRIIPASVDAASETAHGTYSLLLPHGDYTVAAWADYAHDDELSDHSHDTSEGLAALWMNHEVQLVNSADRDAMAGCRRFTHTWDSKQVKVNLTRPFARYRLIATDINDYHSKGRAGRNMTATITCKDFPFMGLDITRMNPATWLQTYTLTSPFEAEGRSVNIATDYSFVSFDSEHKLKVDVNIYEDGELVNTITNLSIPLMSNRETIIEGLLLTYNYRGAGGVGIDEGFEEEIGIIFPK